MQFGNQKLFLHVGDFAERHRVPQKGDRIRFVVGTDTQGRPCAKRATQVRDGGRITVSNWIVLVSLLVMPVLALKELRYDPRIAFGYLVLISAVAFGYNAYDKRRSRSKEWRVSEAALHFLELIGGWPGAFLAQRHLRHKCSKTSYQVIFWGIVVLHQFVALDFLNDWKAIREIASHVESLAR